MNARIHSPKGATSRIAPGSGPNDDTETVNRWLLGAIAEAWRQYPATVELAYDGLGDARELAGRVVDRLAADGLVQLSGTSLALSQAGHAAVDRARHSDPRFCDVLRAGVVPPGSTASSLVVAILRADFELYRDGGRL